MKRKIIIGVIVASTIIGGVISIKGASENSKSNKVIKSENNNSDKEIIKKNNSEVDQSNDENKKANDEEMIESN